MLWSSIFILQLFETFSTINTSKTEAQKKLLSMLAKKNSSSATGWHGLNRSSLGYRGHPNYTSTFNCMS